MVFKRREKLPIWQRLRESVLPRTGWLRAVKYMGIRLKRLPDTPHRIALGLAIGIFVSFSPFFGLHMILGVVFARLLRANAIAGFLGTFFGNPLTFPLILSLSYNFGRWLIGLSGDAPESENIRYSFLHTFNGLWATIKSWFGYGTGEAERLLGFWSEIFLPYLIGGVLSGLFFALAGYYLSYPLIKGYQKHRRSILMAKIRKRAAIDRAEG